MQASDYAKILLKIKAVSLDPDFGFTWASGIKSPIYCDNRLLLSYPEERKQIISGLESLLKNEFSNTEVLAGTATAGIAHAAFLAQNLNLPMVYVRSKAKEHGKQNAIEGHLEKGQKVLVIEDLISTGKSSMQAVNELQEAGADVIGVMSIFTYGFQRAFDTFKEAGVKVRSLLKIEDVLSLSNMNNDEIKKVKNFIKNQCNL